MSVSPNIQYTFCISGYKSELTREYSTLIYQSYTCTPGFVGEEIKERIVSGTGKHVIKSKLNGKSVLKLDYAWVSQRGYYPEDLDKANQDAFLIQPNFSSDGSSSFFGVYDGKYLFR